MTHAAEPTPPTDAETVRADIEATRAELAQTVDALHHKLDVKAQAAAKVADARMKLNDGVARARANPHRTEIVVGGIVALLAVVIVRRRRGSGS
jgi:hypothetical protein